MKRKILQISPELLIDFLRTPTPPGITAEGMPADAKIVGARFSVFTKTLELLIESAEFDEEGYLTVLFHQERV